MDMSEVNSEGEGYIIGIDGGQTGSRAVLSTEDGQILGFSKGGPVLHFASQQSRNLFTSSISNLIMALFRESDLENRKLAAICFGLTGVTAESPEAQTAVELTNTLVDARQVVVHSDAFTALIGAHAGKPGVMVISGTGMVAMGMDRHGEVARCGGWGWALGDDGSAFAIGRDGLRAVMNSYDGISPKTSLTDLFLDYFQVQRVPDIKRIYMDTNFGARAFGQLAALVSKAAKTGDLLAQEIIRENAYALVRCTKTVVHKLDFADQLIPVAPIGGAFEYIHGLKQIFTDEITDTPAIRVVETEFPPMVGALIIALGACGCKLEQVVPNLRRSYEKLNLKTGQS